MLHRQEFSELWMSFIGGNNAAFSKIYKMGHRMLYSYGLNFKVSEEQILDFIQDIFVKIYMHPDLVRNPSTLIPFIFTSMRNACINSERRSNKHVPINRVEEFDVKYSVNEDLMENKEKKLQFNTLVKKMIVSLSPRQKEIIYLKFFNQMPYDEISRIMNITEQAARNLLYKALTKIRNQFDQEEVLRSFDK